MSEIRRSSEGAGEHIWLRYATQFSIGGRTYSVGMEVPMPVGASTEQREQLLREADVGMNQLSTHVEQRVAQMLQRAPQGVTSAPTSPARSANTPASAPAPQTIALSPTPSSSQVRETDYASSQKDATVPPTRPNVGASMPPTPLSGDSSSNISLPQFIQHIKESMGLTPKQAMELLKVKTLTGVNLREALEQLQRLATQEGSTGAPTPLALPAVRPTTDAKITSIEQHREITGTASERRPPIAFDEEIDLEEYPEGAEPEDEREDLDLPHELTPQERMRAMQLLDRFREARGATVASPGRLQVLNNIASSQISAEQLQALALGIWSISNIRKLKVDQVEALISWAKEDDFVLDVEAVLATLEEE